METKEYTVRAGIAIRLAVKNTIIEYLRHKDVEPKITESRELYSSLYIFTVETTEENHDKFRRFLQAYLTILNESGGTYAEQKHDILQKKHKSRE